MSNTKIKFRSQHKVVLDRLLLEIPGVSAGVVFGLPCYRIPDAVFATLYGEGVGVKLPEARVMELLQRPGFVPFQPFGRNRGKEFVQINHEVSEDYAQDIGLFEEAIEFGVATKDQPKVAPRTKVIDVDAEEGRFREIVAALASENSGIMQGKMMSSPAIQYRGKVFAFYYGGKMVFRLGRNFQPESIGIGEYNVLAPFKTKPPLLDWLEIPASQQDRWEELARYALQLMAGN